MSASHPVLLSSRHLVTASRHYSPSPSSTRPSVNSPSAPPGATDSHHALSRYSRPSAMSAPHDGAGGGTPRPRKPSAASNTMMLVASTVASTAMVLARF